MSPLKGATSSHLQTKTCLNIINWLPKIMVQFVSLIRLLIFRHCNYFPCCLILLRMARMDMHLDLKKLRQLLMLCLQKSPENTVLWFSARWWNSFWYIFITLRELTQKCNNILDTRPPFKCTGTLCDPFNRFWILSIQPSKTFPFSFFS